MTMTEEQISKKQAHIPTPIDIMGTPVTPFDSYSQAIDCITSRIAARKKTFCVAINPEKIYCAHNDEELAHILCRANFHICDGVGAAIAARILYGRKVARITGVQLFFELIARAEKEGLKVFLLGAKPESNKLAGLNLRKQYPHLQIVGQQDGYFEDDQAVVHNINVSQADLLFVALGSPRQEKWIIQYSGHIETPFCMGVGGSFDVVSGNVKRAPRLFQKTGTEFLYRVATHSGWSMNTKLQRLLRNILFMMIVLRERFLFSRKASS